MSETKKILLSTFFTQSFDSVVYSFLHHTNIICNILAQKTCEREFLQINYTRPTSQSELLDVNITTKPSTFTVQNVLLTFCTDMKKVKNAKLCRRCKNSLTRTTQTLYLYSMPTEMLQLPQSSTNVVYLSQGNKMCYIFIPR